MYYVYLLQDTNKKLFIGYSSKLNRRLYEHLSKKVYTTKIFLNPQLVYYEAYKTMNEAIEREQKLKQYGSAYHGLLKRLKIM
jgi:putative endonuclease